MGAEPSRSKIIAAARLIGATGDRGAYHVQRRLARNPHAGGAPKVVRVRCLAADVQETGAHEEGGRRARAFSLNTLAAQDVVIDFLKMDIEGAEHAELRTNTEWAERVQTIKVAAHPPSSRQECADDLCELGFETRLGCGDWGSSSVIGIRP